MKDADISLIQSAAKAAGIKLQLALGLSECDSALFTEEGKPWNPLTDDGDALRLAVRLRLNVFHAGIKVYAMDEDGDNEVYEGHETDPCAAARRAIVRAAAEIGKDME